MSRGKIAHAWGQCMRRFFKPKFSGVQGIRYLSCMALFQKHGPPPQGSKPGLCFCRDLTHLFKVWSPCQRARLPVWAQGSRSMAIRKICGKPLSGMQVQQSLRRWRSKAGRGSRGTLSWAPLLECPGTWCLAVSGVEQLRRKYLSPHVWHADFPHSNFSSEFCSVHVIFSP